MRSGKLSDFDTPAAPERRCLGSALRGRWLTDSPKKSDRGSVTLSLRSVRLE